MFRAIAVCHFGRTTNHFVGPSCQAERKAVLLIAFVPAIGRNFSQYW